MLATCAYIDLNPVAAGLVSTPETSPHTSIRSRVQHVKSAGKLDLLKVAKSGSVAGVKELGEVEQGHWLCPILNREESSGREGMIDNFSLGSYLMLVDYTSRLCRTGKARVSGELADIFQRLGTNRQLWSHRIERMFCRERLMGNFFAADPAKLRALAQKKGVHHLDNLCGAAVA